MKKRNFLLYLHFILQLAGTPEYLAPEILFNEGHNHMVDFWCLGVLIYEMLVGYTPFFDESENHKIIEHKIKTGIIKYPDFVSEDAKDLINKLLVRDP
jgi:serum/glucocorticoid-regulated kinase 2